VLSGTINDGLIHAGNLAYLAMLAIFPFFITGAAIFSLFGEPSERAATIDALLTALPPLVGDVIEPVARNVVERRTGWLLWVGGLFGLWTVGSLVETIRDILRRAYGTQPTKAYWKYRLASTGIIVGSVLLLMLSLIAQLIITTAQEVIGAYFPELTAALRNLAWSQFASAAGLFGSLYLLFMALTPRDYRERRYPKWPGALLVALWWIAVSLLLPQVLRLLISYDLTYGSLAGMMISLFFFWLVGLGMVAGAELNAALAETPEEERNRLGRAGSPNNGQDTSAKEDEER
jgi:membrane protein